MSWHSIHVSYHDDDTDALVLDAVRPLFRRLPRQAGGAYFVRHWRRGPHLRLNVETGRREFDDVVVPAARRVIGEFLARHPSTTTLDPHRLLGQHRRLAGLEADPGPLLPWYPANSIHVAPYESRVEVLGTAEAAALVADFYAGTTELTFDTLDRVRAGAQRLGMAFDLLIATAHRLSGGSLSDGFASFRSHAEGFLSGFPEGPALRPGWDRYLHAHTDELVRRTHAVVSTLDDDTGRVPHVHAWVQTLAPLKRRAGELIVAGRLPMDPPADSYDPGLAPLTETSPFHRELMADESFWSELQNAAWFREYRFVLNCLYLHLTRLGVKPVERFLLCHLAAGAVEAGFGVTALDAIRGPAPSRP